MPLFPVTDHEYTLDGGSTWTACTGTSGLSAPVGNVAKAANQVGFRVKASGLRPAGVPRFNTVAFVVSAAAPQYQLAMITDSRGAYPGDTGTDATTSVWALAQARLTSGSTYTGTIVHHGYPGAAPLDYVNTAYTNNNQYTTVKPAGQSPVQYLISQLDSTKIPIIVISAGANGGTFADIKAIHDAIHAAVPNALTIVDPILNRLDVNFPSGLPNRAATNASLHGGLVAPIWTQDEVRSFNTPQIYADEAPSNNLYFWNPDTISGLSKVHLTTAGNQIQGENYAQAYARLLGLVLTPIVATASPTAGILQTSSSMRFSGGGWTNFSPNAQYISGYGGASNSDTATFGFTLNCYGWRIISPTSNIAGAVKAVENGVTIATGTEYSANTPASAGPPIVIMSNYYGGALAVHAVDVLHNATATGVYLFCNLMQFCDSAGNFPAIPAPGPSGPVPVGTAAALVAQNAQTTVSGNQVTAVAGAANFTAIANSSGKLTGVGTLRWTPTANPSGSLLGITRARTATGAFAELDAALYYDGAAINIYKAGTNISPNAGTALNKTIDFVLTASPTDSTLYVCQVQLAGANLGAAFTIPVGVYFLSSAMTGGNIATAFTVSGSFA